MKERTNNRRASLFPSERNSISTVKKYEESQKNVVKKNDPK